MEEKPKIDPRGLEEKIKDSNPKEWKADLTMKDIEDFAKAFNEKNSSQKKRRGKQVR